MMTIGITGGVGAGKTEILTYIETHYNCRIILADQVGNEVKKAGTECFKQLVSCFSVNILQENGEIDKNKMAAAIFADAELLAKVNAIIHPAVTKYILQEMEKEKKRKELDFFFVEAALLIECGYDRYVDELWYIFVNEKIRRERLKNSRQYSDEKITNIMNGQLSETEFRNACQVVIDNSGDFEHTKIQIDSVLGDRLWKMQKNIPDS